MRTAAASLLLTILVGSAAPTGAQPVERIELRQSGWTSLDIHVNRQGESSYDDFQPDLHGHRRGTFRLSAQQYDDLVARLAVYRRESVPEGGWYVGPTVVLAAGARARIATEEIFGPMLTLLRADDFDHALALANDTEYALTAGIFSRSPIRVRRAVDELRAGNIYVNRAITGARVGRQPFGGHGLSGIGSKAGGPDYLRQFVDPRVATENTLRQGFVPMEG